MNKKNLYIIIGGGLVLLALTASLYLVRQNQNINKGASGGGTGLLLLPDTINKKVGEEFTVQVMVNSGGKGVDTTKTKVCFDKNNVGLVNMNPASNITLNSSVFDNVDASVVEEGNNKCLIINALNTSTASVSQGETFKLFDIKFKALIMSEGNISIDATKTEVWGLGSTGEKYQIAIDVSTGAAYKITTSEVTGAKIYLVPSSVSKTVNDEFVSELKVDSDKPVNSMRFYFCYKSDLLRLVDQTIIKNNFVVDNNAFDNVIPGTAITEGENTCFDILFSKITGQLNTATGTIKIADIKLKALKVGSGSIVINKDKCEIGSQTVGLVTGADYTISTTPPANIPPAPATCVFTYFDWGVCSSSGTQTRAVNTKLPLGCQGGTQEELSRACTYVPVAGNEKVLNFKFSFSGVKNDAKCAVGWSVKVIVATLSGVVPRSAITTLSNTFTVVPVRDGNNVNSFGDAIYTVNNLRLVEFVDTDRLAVFIKGSKHLQMKYGVNNQIDFYGKTGGELSGLTSDPVTTPTFDFSGYPILAGDIAKADGSDGQDGVIDGVDFSLSKTQVLTHTTVADGQNLVGDLDGNCQNNSNDLNILKSSLNKKYSELY